MEDEKLLKILRSHRANFVSGAQLCSKLDISKTTLSRHLHQLRQHGYDLQTQPHLGYRLLSVPDRLLAEELSWRLQTKIIGKKILAYNIVDSTNKVAFALAEQGAAYGTTVFAEGQSKGKGRLGRSWVSPKGTGIYFSVVLRPDISPGEASLVTLLAAVSSVEAIRKVTGLRALIRWPNDVLVNNKKVCGILTEMQAEDSRIKFLILGLGVNVNTASHKLPVGAGSLKEESSSQRRLSRLKLAQELMRQLDQHYLAFKEKGAEEIIRQWKNLSAFSGKRVKVFYANKTVEGFAQDIDESGALIVRLDNGFRQHILAGDIVKIR
ncbi:biotin--[acetyl-CoA-carboxylase] ligase [Candidatus Omnitrophota bacterium]